MERDPAITQQISENLLTRLHSFSLDLRKVDDVLGQVETAVAESRIKPLEKAWANILSHFSPFPERKTRQSE